MVQAACGEARPADHVPEAARGDAVAMQHGQHDDAGAPHDGQQQKAAEDGRLQRSSRKGEAERPRRSARPTWRPHPATQPSSATQSPTRYTQESRAPSSNQRDLRTAPCRVRRGRRGRSTAPPPHGCSSGSSRWRRAGRAQIVGGMMMSSKATSGPSPIAPASVGTRSTPAPRNVAAKLSERPRTSWVALH
jgi:hypothetical protein